jgi:hypothetical protein
MHTILDGEYCTDDQKPTAIRVLLIITQTLLLPRIKFSKENVGDSNPLFEVKGMRYNDECHYPRSGKELTIKKFLEYYMKICT